MNNCIGKNNLWLFITFVVLVNLNLIYNLTITVIILCENASYLPDEDVFPPKLPFDALYTPTWKTIVSASVILIAVVFLFPIMLLLIVQIRNGISRMKKQIGKDSILRKSRASYISKNQINENGDKSAFLLQSNLLFYLIG